jgi:hypothetical protein
MRMPTPHPRPRLSCPAGSYFSTLLEAHCLLEGPSTRGAAAIFARHVLDELLGLHSHTPHLLTALHLTGPKPETIGLERLLDAKRHKVRVPCL